MLPLDFILFLQIIIFLFITPGTPRIVIVSYSMNYGVQKCTWTALGDITANFINEKKTIILVEQNAKKGLEFADIGYVLVSGQTAIAGKGNDLLKNPDVGRLFLGG